MKVSRLLKEAACEEFLIVWRPQQDLVGLHYTPNLNKCFPPKVLFRTQRVKPCEFTPDGFLLVRFSSRAMFLHLTAERVDAWRHPAACTHLNRARLPRHAGHRLTLIIGYGNIGGPNDAG